jgi:hypothetical protein
MRKFNGYEEAKVKKGGVFNLPKGAYVLKILNVKEQENKNGGTRFDIAFDIAEGEHKDFYQQMYKRLKEKDEDVKYPNDGIFRLNIPEDDSPGWIKDNFKTFTNALEESNGGYHWDWNETKWKGKLIGGLFHIEQNEHNGKIYNHTRLKYVRSVEDIRNNKYGQLPQDKLIEGGNSSTSASDDMDGFVNVPEGSSEVVFD